MEQKLIKSLIVLGIPGVSLGVFFLLFRNFGFQFSQIDGLLSAVIAIIFIIVVGLITFFALYRWSPQNDKSKTNQNKEKISIEDIRTITLNSVNSTNDESYRLISNSEQLPFIVHAWNQTRGKGKNNRIWVGGAGILTASWNYSFKHDRATPEIINVVGIISAIAVRDAIINVNPDLREVNVKWPNDVLIGGEKVAGILIEIKQDIDEIQCIIGIGVNVSRTPVLTDFKKYTLPPCSIFSDYYDDNVREVRIIKTLNAITKCLNNRIQRLFEEKSLNSQKNEWEKLDYYLNKQVEIKTPQSDVIIKGINKGINLYGQLILEISKNYIKEFYSGDVTAFRGAFDEIDELENYKTIKVRKTESTEGEIIEEVLSPIIGRVMELSNIVDVGVKVNKKQVLCKVEAMKMGWVIESPTKGILKEICFQVGDLVKENDVLFKISVTD